MDKNERAEKRIEKLEAKNRRALLIWVAINHEISAMTRKIRKIQDGKTDLDPEGYAAAFEQKLIGDDAEILIEERDRLAIKMQMYENEIHRIRMTEFDYDPYPD